jgi:hypothetical protein
MWWSLLILVVCSSLHALSNGAKHCKVLCRNRQEIDTAKALSIVIIQKQKTKSHFRSLNYLNFEYVTHACQANTSAWTVGAASITPA